MARGREGPEELGDAVVLFIKRSKVQRESEALMFAEFP
jgi:hypothetical protein